MKFPFAFLGVLIMTGALEINGVPINNEQHKVLADSGLLQDLQDFMQLIPIMQIQEIFYEYLAEDEDFGAALDYVMSDEFKSLIMDIEALAEVKDLLDFLQDSGINAYEFITTINSLLGIDHMTRITNSRLTRITGGLPGFIMDIKAILPIKEIENLYEQKLETSKNFAELIKRLSSEEFQGLVDKIIANPKLQNLINRAEAKGVDVQAILDFFTTILGLKFPSRPVFLLTRNLKDDFNDFMALVPVEKIQEIFFEYMAEDEDFGAALDYVMSDEFKYLIVEVEGQSEVKSLLKFLQDSGLDAYEFVNKINDLLGIDRITPKAQFKVNRITGGLPGFLKDIGDALPLKEIEKMYQNKMETSKEFFALVKSLSSREFQGLVDKIMTDPKLQNLLRRAQAKGVDVQAVFDFLTTLLGLHFP